MEFLGEEKKVTIVLADDHEVVRSGIRRLLSIDKKLVIIDEASDGEEAVELVNYHKPDIAMLDILMPRMNGIIAAEKIKQQNRGIFVVMLTAFEDYKHIDDALSAGADAYLSKNVTARELIDSLWLVMKGERVLSKSIVRALQKKVSADNNEEESHIIITKREQEILDMVAAGKTSSEIADSLNISVRTVESHRYNLMQKLGAKNTAALVRYAVSNRDYLKDLE
jgi:two-component system, NarL family, response regulator NreC